jgi:hypothetical protein
VQHSIDRIIAACDKAIEAQEAEATKKHDDHLARLRKSAKDALAKRKVASDRFREIAAVLTTGSSLNESDEQFLKNLHYYSSDKRKVRLEDLTHDYTKEPEAPKQGAAAWLYELKRTMINLKQDNDGKTTVSTSFLKDLGYGGDVIRWVARI